MTGFRLFSMKFIRLIDKAEVTENQSQYLCILIHFLKLLWKFLLFEILQYWLFKAHRMYFTLVLKKEDIL